MLDVKLPPGSYQISRQVTMKLQLLAEITVDSGAATVLETKQHKCGWEDLIARGYLSGTWKRL